MKETVSYAVMVAMGFAFLALILARVFFFSNQSTKVMQDGLNEGAVAIEYYRDDFKPLAGQTVDGSTLINTLRKKGKEVPSDLKARNYYIVDSDGSYSELDNTVEMPEYTVDLHSEDIASSDSSVPEETLVVTSVENSSMLPQPNSTIETGKSYSYRELREIIASSNFAVTYTIEGAFGTFSCRGGDPTPLDTFYRIFRFSQLAEGFNTDDTASDQSTQAYLRVDDTLVSATDVLEHYCGHLVYGYNLSRAIDASDVCTYDVKGADTYVQGDDLDKTSLYCVYKGERGYLIDNSGVYTGATLNGTVWKEWLSANNNAWTYNLELDDETNYTFKGCTFDPLGVVTEISLE